MTTETPNLSSAEFLPVPSSVQGTGRVSSQPVMKVTGTSSAQTAGCGHTESQQSTFYWYQLSTGYWTGLPAY